MNEKMEFPETFEGFTKEYGFKDDKEVYTNGSDLISIFRVKQWLEHDNKLRRIEIDTAYECGKHANKWIPVSERLPRDGERVLATHLGGINPDRQVIEHIYENGKFALGWDMDMDMASPTFGQRYMGDVIAWMPLPEPYEAENEVSK